jgi:hypothetical protein
MKRIVQLGTITIILALTSSIDCKAMKSTENPITRDQITTTRQINQASDAAQEANDVKNLLATLHERTWSGDLRGYTGDQVKEANQKLELLNLAKNNLTKKIVAQEAKMAEMTDTKFWGLWSSAKEGMEEGSNNAAIKLINLKIKLAKINRAISNEKVVAGKAYAFSLKKIPMFHHFLITDLSDLYVKKYDLLKSKYDMLRNKMSQLSSEARNYVIEQSKNLPYHGEKLSLSYSDLQKFEKYLNTSEKIINEKLEREKSFYNSKIYKNLKNE